MEFRIGDRDSVSGLYDVIWPDGGVTRNGLKVFNSEHQFGDVVLATQRSDGLMILDGVKAVEVPTPISSATVSPLLGGDFSGGGVGYLYGQVWNDEDEAILPTVSIEFALGSPTQLLPNAGGFVIRIKIDRPQSRDLRVQCELSGTAVSSDYYVVGLDVNRVAVILAGETYFDVAIFPTQNQMQANESVVLSILNAITYRIGQNSSVSAVIMGDVTPIQYRIARYVGISSNGTTGSLTLECRLGGRAQDVGKLIACVFRSVDFNGNPVLVQGNDLVVNYALSGSAKPAINYVAPAGATVYPLAVLGSITIPVGSSSATLLIEPIIQVGQNKILQVGLTSGSYTSASGTPQAYIQEQATAKISLSDSYNGGGGFFPGNTGSFVGGDPWIFDIKPAFDPNISDPDRKFFVEFDGTAQVNVDFVIVTIATPDSSGLIFQASGTFRIESKDPGFPPVIPTKTVIVRLVADGGYDIDSPSETSFLVR